MSTIYHKVLEVLSRYVSEINAVCALNRALREAGLDAKRLTCADLSAIQGNVERRLQIFVDIDLRTILSAELADVGAAVWSGRSQTLPVKEEADVSTGRLAAKAICDGLGAKSFIVHKVVTIVSELSRNIVHYTTGGTIELTVLRERRLRLIIVAKDTGPGIQDLSLIMSGQYRSKTGMGRGLVGVKRLAETFDISTGPNGTLVNVEVNL